jgi:hypothetical protein
MKLVTTTISTLTISPHGNFSGDDHIVNFILLKFNILTVMYFQRFIAIQNARLHIKQPQYFSHLSSSHACIVDVREFKTIPMQCCYTNMPLRGFVGF